MNRVAEQQSGDLPSGCSVFGVSWVPDFRRKSVFKTYAPSGEKPHWCGDLPHRQAPPQGIEGAVTQPGGDCQATGGWGMNIALKLIVTIQVNFRNWGYEPDSKANLTTGACRDG